MAEKARLVLAAAAFALLAAAGSAGAQVPKKGPAWAELTAEHQQILAPLKDDWGQIAPDRRRNWIALAKRYPTMNAKEQERIQRRMERWAKLTPEQRKQARENYRRISKVPPDKRGDLKQQWSEYQSLPPQERQGAAPPKKKTAPAK